MPRTKRTKPKVTVAPKPPVAVQSEPAFVLVHPTDNIQYTFRPDGEGNVLVTIRVISTADNAHALWYSLREKGYDRI